ncbi:MAG: hypothetical protein K2X91_00490, partial [Thermoleophilia bacterium]|nr:hypothetical protein [Thermoleophilia bacterium]
MRQLLEFAGDRLSLLGRGPLTERREFVGRCFGRVDICTRERPPEPPVARGRVGPGLPGRAETLTKRLLLAADLLGAFLSLTRQFFKPVGCLLRCVLGGDAEGLLPADGAGEVRHLVAERLHLVVPAAEHHPVRALELVPRLL